MPAHSRPPPAAPRATAAGVDARLHAAGLRRTRALRAVQALFERAPAWSPTHQQVAAQLAADGEAINPVTLYRLLDRLVAAGLLARRTADGERAWRFQWLGDAAPASGRAAQPHFECDHCHSQFPLAGADEPAQAVARALRRSLARLGHQAARVDLAVHGTCAGCRAGA